MPRKKSKFKPIPLPLSLLEPTHKLLEQLIETGVYGNNPTEVAKTIVLDHLRELEKAKKIKTFPKIEDDEK